jgi:hypothetical protein
MLAVEITTFLHRFVNFRHTHISAVFNLKYHIICCALFFLRVLAQLLDLEVTILKGHCHEKSVPKASNMNRGPILYRFTYFVKISLDFSEVPTYEWNAKFLPVAWLIFPCSN